MMANWYALWYGGASYAQPQLEDIEEFESLDAATEEFERRAWVSNKRYPAVDSTATMYLFAHYPTEDMYPDMIIKFSEANKVVIEVL